MPCSLTYANSTAINITNGALPGNFCHTTWQTTLDTFTSSLSASLTGNTSTFTFGPTTPTAENRDRPWLKVDTTTCKAVGWYFYNTVTSAWEPVLVQDVDNLLTDTGVVAGTYPLATIGVNAKGRVTTAVAGNATGMAKAWVTINEATGAIVRSYNVSGVTRGPSTYGSQGFTSSTATFVIGLSITCSGSQLVSTGVTSNHLNPNVPSVPVSRITATTVTIEPGYYTGGRTGTGTFIAQDAHMYWGPTQSNWSGASSPALVNLIHVIIFD